MNKPEYELQKSIFEWAALNKYKYPELKWMHSSLYGIRLTIGQAVKAKKSGMKKGIYDIFVPRPHNEFFGLYIECKADKNKLTMEQKEFKKDMEESGYICGEVRSLKEFIDLINWYFEKGHI